MNLEAYQVDIPYLPQTWQEAADWGYLAYYYGYGMAALAMPARPTWRPCYAGPWPVDATASLRSHLDSLERAELGPRRRDVTRGEWFALAMERRRQRARAADTAFARIAAIWGGPTDSHPRPPTHYELSDTGSYRAASRLEPRHRPFPP